MDYHARQRIKKTIEFGLHSNIPLCCVLEFALNFNLRRGITARKIERKTKKRIWSYIPCDKCLKRKYAQKLHLCNPGCGAEKILPATTCKSMFKRNQLKKEHYERKVQNYQV